MVVYTQGPRELVHHFTGLEATEILATVTSCSLDPAIGCSPLFICFTTIICIMVLMASQALGGPHMCGFCCLPHNHSQ